MDNELKNVSAGTTPNETPSGPAPEPTPTPTGEPTPGPTGELNSEPAGEPTPELTPNPLDQLSITPSPNTKKPDNKRTIIVSVIGLIIIIAIAIVTVIMMNGGIGGGKPINDNPPEVLTPPEPADDNTPTGSGNTPSNASVSSNWQDYAFSINGTSLTLPIKYTEFSKISGFTMKEVEAGNSISANHYTLANMYKDSKLALSTEVTNSSEGTLKLSECDVTRISQSALHIKQSDTPITFPGGLTAGMSITEDEIFKLFGTTDNTSHYEGDSGVEFIQDVYTYSEDKDWTTFNFYKITVVNGAIDELTLDHRSTR